MSAAPALFVINDDIWREAGLSDYPANWQEVYKAAHTIKNAGYMPLCIEISNLYHITQYLLSFGGNWNAGVDMNTAENREAISFILKMFYEGLKIRENYNLDIPDEFLEEAKLAMAYGMDKDIENAGKILEPLLVQVKEMAESSIPKDELEEGLERIEQDELPESVRNHFQKAKEGLDAYAKSGQESFGIFDIVAEVLSNVGK